MAHKDFFLKIKVALERVNNFCQKNIFDFHRQTYFSNRIQKSTFEQWEIHASTWWYGM